jgi:hypothetical protein
VPVHAARAGITPQSEDSIQRAGSPVLVRRPLSFWEGLAPCPGGVLLWCVSLCQLCTSVPQYRVHVPCTSTAGQNTEHHNASDHLPGDRNVSQHLVSWSHLLVEFLQPRFAVPLVLVQPNPRSAKQGGVYGCTVRVVYNKNAEEDDRVNLNKDSGSRIVAAARLAFFNLCRATRGLVGHLTQVSY